MVVGMWAVFYRMYVWVASRYVNCNSDNANFGLRNANNNINGNNMFNSNNNNNNDNNRLRPVDSINCGYAITDCIRDNIETNLCPVAFIAINQKQINFFVSRFYKFESEKIL